MAARESFSLDVVPVRRGGGDCRGERDGAGGNGPGRKRSTPPPRRR